MRRLVILRGPAGTGKTSWVKQHKLEMYTLSPDNIRLMVGSPMFKITGQRYYTTSNDSSIWSILFQCLEERMKRGDLTIIDAMHLRQEDVLKYKRLSQKYKYDLYCVDFSEVDFKQAVFQNHLEPEYKQFSKEAIQQMYERQLNSSLPKYIKTVKPAEFNSLLYHPVDLSSYKKIHNIGDIHGCYNVLMEYINKQGGIKKDEFYIFTGDYIDKGPSSDKVFNFLNSIIDYPNVICLEGNHESNLNVWSFDKKLFQKSFINTTYKQFKAAKIDKKKAKIFYKKLKECFYYIYDGKPVIACHGGISTLLDNPIFIPAYNLINGMGTYEDSSQLDELFTQNTNKQMYQMHGHRNPTKLSLDNSAFSFTLENDINSNGSLCCTQFTHSGIQCFNIKNNQNICVS